MSTRVDPGREASQQEIVITRVFDAPRKLVFKAWTDAKHVATWWGPKGFTSTGCEIDLRAGGAFRLQMHGPDGVVCPCQAVFREIVEPERIVYSGAPEDGPACGAGLPPHAVVTVSFAEQDGKTTLTINTRWESSANLEAALAVGFIPGWASCLVRLAEHLAMKNEPLVMERTFHAPVGTVWKALTSKDDMKSWYFDLKEFRPEVGYEFAFAVEHEGMRYNHLCIITEVIRERKNAYTWRYEGYPGDSLVTFELFPDGDKTRLKLTHEGLASFAKLPSFAKENFAQGWTQLIGKNLKEFVETASKDS